MGVLGDHPPTDPDGFARFAADLALPDVHEILQDAEPLDEPVAYRYPSSVRNRYDRLTRFPDGLVVLGDAVCTLNPIYGQGMTVAALEAAALHRHLANGRPLRPQLLRTSAGSAGSPGPWRWAPTCPSPTWRGRAPRRPACSAGTSGGSRQAPNTTRGSAERSSA